MAAPTRQTPGVGPRDLHTDTDHSAAVTADPTATAGAVQMTPADEIAVGTGTRPRPHTPRGAYLRLAGDAEAMAADLIERVGPAAAMAMAAEVVALVGGAR